MATTDPRMRVSDDEREDALAQLRRHMLAGRLTADELDERMSEASTARTVAELDYALRELPRTEMPAPLAFRSEVSPSDGDGAATIAVVLGAFSVVILVMSFGLASRLCLPLSVAAWGVGHHARQRATGSIAARARTGEILGIVGAGLSLLPIAGCAALLS